MLLPVKLAHTVAAPITDSRTPLAMPVGRVLVRSADPGPDSTHFLASGETAWLRIGGGDAE